MAVVFNGENVGIAFPIERQDRLQWKCDNMRSLYHEFYGYEGTSLDETLAGLNTGNVTNMYGMFYSCRNLTTIPQLDTGNVANMYQMFSFCNNLTTIPQLDTGNVTDMYQMFQGCNNLTTIPQLNTGNVTNMSSMFYNCKSLTTMPQLNTGNVTNMRYMFNSCRYLTAIPQLDTGNVTDMNGMFLECHNLTTIPQLNIIKVTNMSSMFSACYKLTNLTLKNISGKTNLVIGSGTTWGHLLTDDSLINTAKELWDLTGSTSKTLTVSTPSNARFDEIYVKLIDITDEMRAEDQYIDNKKPCVVSESTDEGAMTLREYVVSKNWALA